MKKNRIRVLPYKQGSKSAKALAEALGGMVLRLEGSAFVPRSSDVIINWGRSTNNHPLTVGQAVARIINLPEVVGYASNKLNFFKAMPSDIVPAFWTNQEDIPDEAFPIVCRTILSGHSGAGIVIADNRGGLVSAPLYVKYVKKQDEYRIHVGKNGDTYTTIAVQRKARRTSVDNPNWQIRNHANGFVFVRQDVQAPALALDVAQRAVLETGLDFGAVDVIWNNHEQRAYVLEINTAPGLEGQTVTDYANYFKEII